MNRDDKSTAKSGNSSGLSSSKKSQQKESSSKSGSGSSSAGGSKLKSRNQATAVSKSSSVRKKNNDTSSGGIKKAREQNSKRCLDQSNSQNEDIKEESKPDNYFELSSSIESKVIAVDQQPAKAEKGRPLLEQETDIDELDSCEASPLRGHLPGAEDHIIPRGWEQHSDASGFYYWHAPTGLIQRDKPQSEPQVGCNNKEPVIFCNDDEEINQTTMFPKSQPSGLNTDYSGSSDDLSRNDGAALTVDDTSESTFLVYPLGCCDLDETELVSSISTKVIQKCILRLSMRPASASNSTEDSCCWGVDSSQAILMKLFDDHIQFIDFKSQLLLRSQPIQTIRTWAVDDDNNFAFVIEDLQQREQVSGGESQDELALLEASEPRLVCYVFHSVDEDDDMSCRVSKKLNAEISRYKEQMIERIERSARIQQMRPIEDLFIEAKESQDLTNNQTANPPTELINEQLDEPEEEEDGSGELTLRVKYIGSTPVSRPTGIEVLNLAIDRCFTNGGEQLEESTSKLSLEVDASGKILTQGEGNLVDSPMQAKSSNRLVEAKLHVSPSSVIIENEKTGEIIVECRIRYLTFIGISKRDIRWCGFIMQNALTKGFEVHALECLPTAGQACEAIQSSCVSMYERVVKSSRQHVPETLNLIPTRTSIRDTLAKTLSRIKLNPIG